MQANLLLDYVIFASSTTLLVEVVSKPNMCCSQSVSEHNRRLHDVTTTPLNAVLRQRYFPTSHLQIDNMDQHDCKLLVEEVFVINTPPERHKAVFTCSPAWTFSI